MSNWKKEKDEESYSRKGTNGSVALNGWCVVELRKNKSGSGPTAFGRFNEWPVVHSEIVLPADRPELALNLIDRIKELVDNFYKEYEILETAKLDK